jgi:hypothetical protein
VIPGLLNTVQARLKNGPASAHTLARFCDLRLGLMERLLEGHRKQRKLRKVAGRYALPRNPYSPAGRIVIRGYRWGA